MDANFLTYLNHKSDPTIFVKNYLQINRVYCIRSPFEGIKKSRHKMKSAPT